MLFGEHIDSQTDISSGEKSVFRERILKRWMRTDISKIYIPADLLESRHSLTKNSDGADGFRMLQKFDSSDFKRSFSVYSGYKSDDEIFSSDSDEEFFHNFNRTCSNNVSSGVPCKLDTSPSLKSSSSLSDVASKSPALLKPVDDCPLQDDIEELEMLPIILPRKDFSNHELKNATQIKKEKKRNKTKVNKSMHLNYFLESVDSSCIPESDEFYESIMGKPFHLKNHVEIECVSKFPSLKCSEPENHVEYNKEIEYLSFNNTCNKASEPEKRVAKIKGCAGTNDFSDGKILVMEDIPCDVPRENIEEILPGTGELVDLKKHGEFLKAEFRMSSDVELEWIISCMNGSQPFGAYSTEVKCYEKTV